MSISAELGRRCQAADREPENIDEWTNSDINQCTAAQLSSGLQDISSSFDL